MKSILLIIGLVCFSGCAAPAEQSGVPIPWTNCAPVEDAFPLRLRYFEVGPLEPKMFSFQDIERLLHLEGQVRWDGNIHVLEPGQEAAWMADDVPLVQTVFLTQTVFLDEEGQVLAGANCGNRITLNIPLIARCPDEYFAHELGHSLGYGHTQTGFMNHDDPCNKEDADGN